MLFCVVFAFLPSIFSSCHAWVVCFVCFRNPSGQLLNSSLLLDPAAFLCSREDKFTTHQLKVCYQTFFLKVFWFWVWDGTLGCMVRRNPLVYLSRAGKSDFLWCFVTTKHPITYMPLMWTQIFIKAPLWLLTASSQSPSNSAIERAILFGQKLRLRD